MNGWVYKKVDGVFVYISPASSALMVYDPQSREWYDPRLDPLNGWERVWVDEDA